MTVGFMRWPMRADAIQPPTGIAIAIGSDVSVPLLCEQSLFRAEIPPDAAKVAPPANDHGDNGLRRENVRMRSTEAR